MAYFSFGFFALPGEKAAAAGLNANITARECRWNLAQFNDPNTIYLSSNGGTNNQVQINNALQQIKGEGKKSVYLKAGTYLIDGPIIVPSGSSDDNMITLEGDQNAKIKLIDYAGWHNNRFLAVKGFIPTIQIL